MGQAALGDCAIDGVEPITTYVQENDDYISHWLTEKVNWLGETQKLDRSRRNISYFLFIFHCCFGGCW